jgi:hypothetical protein
MKINSLLLAGVIATFSLTASTTGFANGGSPDMPDKVPLPPGSTPVPPPVPEPTTTPMPSPTP